MVTIPDPEGFSVHIIFGQEPVTSKPAPEKLPLNYEIEKERIRKFQRFQPGPAEVHKVSPLLGAFITVRQGRLNSNSSFTNSLVTLGCVRLSLKRC